MPCFPLLLASAPPLAAAALKQPAPVPPRLRALQVDSALLAHPGVAEAVSFAAPDGERDWAAGLAARSLKLWQPGSKFAPHLPRPADKYGEVVAAAVVLNDQGKATPDIGGYMGRCPALTSPTEQALAARGAARRRGCCLPCCRRCSSGVRAAALAAHCHLAVTLGPGKG